MRRIGLLLIFLAGLLIAFQAVYAQESQPVVVLMNASGAISPAMQDYIERGLKTAAQQNAEAVIIQLSTPGGDILSLDKIIQDIRGSSVPVVVYVGPNGAWAASAGALMTMSAHVAAMAPETAIGASSPVASGGADLPEDLEDLAPRARPALEPRRASVACHLSHHDSPRSRPRRTGCTPSRTHGWPSTG